MAEALAGREDDPLESMLQLRFMGAVHRLALSGEAPELAALYPSCGGGGSVAGAWEPFRTAVAVNLDELRSLVGKPVQTNEVGRSRALALGFLTLAERDRAAAAAARGRVERGSQPALGRVSLLGRRVLVRAGGLAGPVRRLRRRPASLTARARTDRGACRVRRGAGGLDDDGRLTLRSYLWPDQLDRLRVLDGALEVAAVHPGFR